MASLHSLPEGAIVKCGGKCNLNIKRSSYVELWLDVVDNYVTLYKRVSHDLKTQEGTVNETLWAPGTTLEVPNWDPASKECGPGKFHGCARPEWCDIFRSRKDDKYVSVRVHVDDLYQWPDRPRFPQKIAFRKGTVIKVI